MYNCGLLDTSFSIKSKSVSFTPELARASWSPNVKAVQLLSLRRLQENQDGLSGFRLIKADPISMPAKSLRASWANTSETCFGSPLYTKCQ